MSVKWRALYPPAVSNPDGETEKKKTVEKVHETIEMPEKVGALQPLPLLS